MASNEQTTRKGGTPATRSAAKARKVRERKAAAGRDSEEARKIEKARYERRLEISIERAAKKTLRGFRKLIREAVAAGKKSVCTDVVETRWWFNDKDDDRSKEERGKEWIEMRGRNRAFDTLTKDGYVLTPHCERHVTVCTGGFDGIDEEGTRSEWVEISW